MRRIRAGRRAGFTMVELLVVIAMIALLLTLAAGTYFRVRNAAVKHTSEIMVEKVASAMDQQVKAVVDQAREEFLKPELPPYSFVRDAVETIAQQDRRRAQAIYIKLRIKQEFPQSFAEINNPTLIGANVPSPTNPLFLRGLPPKQNYMKAIAGMALGPADQNAACLYLALSVSRRGVPGVRAEELGPNAVTELGPPGKSLRAYVDAWGGPLMFCRWPCANAELASLGGGDTQDPESLLYFPANAGNSLWFAYINGTWGGSYNYLSLQSQLHTLSNVPVNVSPVIISTGPNRILDSDPISLNDSTNPSADDILSFRLRKTGSKGD